MATVLQFGRCEISDLGGPMSLSVSGGTVQVQGELRAESYAKLAMLRAQLNGLLNNPFMPVVPCKFADHPDLNGYYRVTDLSTQGDGSQFTAFTADFSIFLESVGTRATVVTEVLTAAVDRGFGSSTTVTVAAASAAAQSSPSPSFSRVGEDGEVYVSQHSAALPWTKVSRVVQGVDDFFVGACRIEQLVDGDWHPFDGRRVSPELAGAWRITNGLVALEPKRTGNVGVVELSVWDEGSAEWDLVLEASGISLNPTTSGTNVYTLGAGYVNDGINAEWLVPSVLRNDRSGVVIGFTTPRSVSLQHTFSLRPGEHFVELAIGAVNTSTNRWGVRAPNGETGSVGGLTGAVKQATSGTTGHQWVLGTNSTNAADVITTPGGRVYGADGERSLLMLGAVKFSAGTLGPDGAAAVLGQWTPGVSQSIRVVTS